MITAPISLALGNWVLVLLGIGADLTDLFWVIDFLSNGVIIWFSDYSPLPVKLKNYSNTSVHPSVLSNFVSQEVGLGHYIAPDKNLSLPHIPLRIIPVSMIEKKKSPGSFRRVVDCSAPQGFSINDVSSPLSFQMVIIDYVLDRISPGMVGVKLDVMSAFRNIPLRCDHGRLCAIQHEGQIFEDSRLPMGWNRIPQTF